MTRVLLTGGTGFVGRQILRRLQERGCSVRMVQRGSAAVPDGVEVWSCTDLFEADPDALRAACLGVDVVLHAAWYAEPGKYVESPKNLTCLAGTLRLGEAAVGSGVKRFVGVGTCFEYDLTAGFLRTTTPLMPKTLYGAAKASAFLTLSRLMAMEGRSFAWCRLFYLFGEGEDGRRLVPYLRDKLTSGMPAELSSGRQVRDFLDVAEAGRRIADAALSGVEGPLNICSGEPITVRQLAERLADDYGRRDLLHFGARTENPADPACIIGEPSLV